jgi:hypothetical protein
MLIRWSYRSFGIRLIVEFGMVIIFELAIQSLLNTDLLGICFQGYT